jgi:hypothetical protein
LGGAHAVQTNPLVALVHSNRFALYSNREDALWILYVHTHRGLWICASFAFVAWEDGPVSRLWSAIFGLLVVLFKPIIPIYLNRGTWFYFDLLAASLFAANLLVVRIGVIRTKTPTEEQRKPLP